MNINDMWERLTTHQPYADAKGYGPDWARMCAARTAEAAWVAAWAAEAALASALAAWAAEAAALAASLAADALAAEAVEWIEKAEGLK